MCHSLAPSGQPGMMHKNFMPGKRLPVFAVRRTGREVLCLNSGALRGAGYEHTPAGIDGHVRDRQRIRIRDEDTPPRSYSGWSASWLSCTCGRWKGTHRRSWPCCQAYPTHTKSKSFYQELVSFYPVPGSRNDCRGRFYIIELLPPPLLPGKRQETISEYTLPAAGAYCTPRLCGCARSRGWHRRRRR